MAEPHWQETLRHRLTERNAKESAVAPIIEQYRRLAQQTKLLKERNQSLLRAVNTVKGNPSSSTVYVAGTSDDNPVRAAYVQSLESQISSLRDEISGVYKTQGQNTQRLLSMTETLREKEEQSRLDSENLRRTKEELNSLRRKVDQHNELMSEKDRAVQVLHDEISTLQLELGQIEERNQSLTKDNAKLLQRWLDAKQNEANKMNEANEFYESVRSRQDNSVNGDDSRSSTSSVSGNGDAREASHSTEMKDGITSPASKSMGPTPNG